MSREMVFSQQPLLRQLENKGIVSGWDNWTRCVMRRSLDTFVSGLFGFGRLPACPGSSDRAISTGPGQKSNLCERSFSKSALGLIELLSVRLRRYLNKTCPPPPPPHPRQSKSTRG